MPITRPTGDAGVRSNVQLKGKGINMSMKLKVLGLGLLAVLATSAFAVVNASATTSGHFVSHAKEHHLVLEGTETFPGEHNLVFQRTVNGAASGEPIRCTHVAYHGTLEGTAATTTQSVALRPDYTSTGTPTCSTGGVAPHNVEIHVPTACGTNVFVFTSGNPGTVHDECEITVTHPNCTIRMPKQTLNGVTYKAIKVNNADALTAEVNVQGITGHFEGGACIFLGTTQIFHMKGSVRVWAKDKLGNPVGITHTAP
jgi:hypothetical protein